MMYRVCTNGKTSQGHEVRTTMWIDADDVSQAARLFYSLGCDTRSLSVTQEDV